MLFRQNCTVTLKIASANYDTPQETYTVHTMQELCTSYIHHVHLIFFDLTVYFFKRNSLAVNPKMCGDLIFLIGGSNEFQILVFLNTDKYSLRGFSWHDPKRIRIKWRFPSPSGAVWVRSTRSDPASNPVPYMINYFKMFCSTYIIEAVHTICITEEKVGGYSSCGNSGERGGRFFIWSNSCFDRSILSILLLGSSCTLG